MIVTFQSKAGGDVIMFGDVAHRLMEIMGKEATPQGIVTVEQLPDAIACLKAAVVKDKEAHGRIVAGGLEPETEKPEGNAPQAISLTQRAIPLLELLELSMRKRVPVVWGV